MNLLRKWLTSLTMWVLAKRANRKQPPMLAEWTPDWSIEKAPPLPLKVIEFDPKFPPGQDIDFERDIAWPLRVKDIN